MLIPQQIVVAPSAQETLLGAAEELKAGFELEEAEQGVRVRAVPASVAPDEIQLSGARSRRSPEAQAAAHRQPGVRRCWVMLSCHTSIRTGHPLTLAEQQALIDQLSRCQGPRTCPMAAQP